VLDFVLETLATPKTNPDLCVPGLETVAFDPIGKNMNWIDFQNYYQTSPAFPSCDTFSLLNKYRNNAVLQEGIMVDNRPVFDWPDGEG